MSKRDGARMLSRALKHALHEYDLDDDLDVECIDFDFIAWVTHQCAFGRLEVWNPDPSHCADCGSELPKRRHAGRPSTRCAPCQRRAHDERTRRRAEKEKQRRKLSDYRPKPRLPKRELFQTSWCCVRCHAESTTSNASGQATNHRRHVTTGHCDSNVRASEEEAKLFAAIHERYPSTLWSEEQWADVLIADPVMEEMVYDDMWIKLWRDGPIKNDKWRRTKRRSEAVNPDAS